MTGSSDVEGQLAAGQVAVHGEDLPSEHGGSGNQTGGLAGESVGRGLAGDFHGFRRAGVLDGETGAGGIDPGVEPQANGDVGTLCDSPGGGGGFLENGVAPQGRQQDQTKNALMHNFVVELLRRQYQSMEAALKERIA